MQGDTPAQTLFFKLLQGGSACPRLGTIFTRQGSFNTPVWIPHTRKGSPTNLTPDLVQNMVPETAALPLQVGLHDFFEHTMVLKGYTPGFRQFIGYPCHPIYLAVHNICAYQELPCTKDHLPVQTSSGRAKVTPAAFMEHVQTIQPDFFGCLSHQLSNKASKKQSTRAVDISLSWLDDCLSKHREDGCRLLGVIQGGGTSDQRLRSATETAKRPVDGFVLSAVGLGDSAEERVERLQAVMVSCFSQLENSNILLKKELPETKPRLLAGLGAPDEVIQFISLGIDMFHSAYPDTLTEAGLAMVFPIDLCGTSDQGGKRKREESSHSDSVTIDLKSKMYATDASPIVQDCPCFSCTNHTRAYLHHLFMTKEMLGSVLLTVHNNTHYGLFFKTIAQHMKNGTLPIYYDHICTKMKATSKSAE